MSSFLTSIGNHLDDILSSFSKQIERTGMEFDYDIFADTMLKCDEKIRDNMSYKEQIGYFWVAFKQNTLNYEERKKSKIERFDENTDIEDENNYSTDVEIISSMIKEKFGTETYELYLRHLNGENYENLSTMGDNLKYKFRRIREYVRANYRFE